MVLEAGSSSRQVVQSTGGRNAYWIVEKFLQVLPEYSYHKTTVFYTQGEDSHFNSTKNPLD